MPLRAKTDWILFGAVLAMASFGMLMLYSASSMTGLWNPQSGSSLKFVARQAGWWLAAAAIMLALKRTYYRKFQDPAVAFPAIGIALVLLVLVYFIDKDHHRWIRIGSFIGIQPSELAKPALVIFLAFFVTWRARAISHLRYTLIPAALMVGGVLFAVVIPDLGTAAVLGAASMIVFFVAGLEWRYFAAVLGIAFLGVVVSVVIEPYRLGRVVRFVDPQFTLIDRIDPGGHIKAYIGKSLRTHDTNYQAEESKIAVGSGGAMGLGLMNGRQKLFVPESHTDFIYAVVGEEMGFLGAAGLLIGFGVIFWRGLRASVRMGDDFGRYLALGATVVVVLQAFINISVALGITPTKGIPLPMISYGGSSLLSTLAMMGILMNVAEHAG
jgi:cell division protein FtsW